MSFKNSVKTIDAVDAHSIDYSLICHCEPVVFKGLVADWECINLGREGSNRLVDHFNRHAADQSLLVNVGEQAIKGRYFYNSDCSELNYQTVRMPVTEALSRVEAAGSGVSDESVYISSTSIARFFPTFNEHLQLGLPRKPVSYPVSEPDIKIWIGTRSVASCHFDALDNLACVVAGKRRFTVFPPDQIENLYFGPLDKTPGGQPVSMVDFDNPDYERFPKFKQAEKVGVVANLEPGDAIYIPSMWLHHVEGLSDINVLLNYWWDDAPQYTGAGMVALQHAMLSIRDKPAHEKEGWKALFDHYVFGDPRVNFEHIPPSARGVLGELNGVHSRQLRAKILNYLNR